MIPKILHYCWFWGNPLPELEERCLASWNRYMPQLSLPITEMLADSELSLPISPCMTPEQVKFVVDAINEFK